MDRSRCCINKVSLPCLARSCVVSCFVFLTLETVCVLKEQEMGCVSEETTVQIHSPTHTHTALSVFKHTYVY